MPKGQKNTKTTAIKQHIFLLLSCICLLGASCSPTRKLADDQYLLVKNVVKNDSKVVSKGDLEKFIRQKPNRKILGFYRFHLQVYNLVDKSKMEERAAVLEKKNERRNLRRKKKGKDPKERRRSFWEWLMDIGEAPVIYDQLTAEKSADQLEVYLRGKGHFNAVVSDSVVVNEKKQKAQVVYKVQSGTPYTVRNVTYEIEDERIARLARAMRSRERVLSDGMLYDVELFQKERERIERNLKSNGYYAFSDDYVRFRVDSNLNSHQVDLTLTIAPPESGDTTVGGEREHQTYTIRNVFVNTDHDSKRSATSDQDTLIYNGVHFIYKGKFKHRPEMLLRKMFLEPGDLYRVKRGEMTYQFLSGLRAYRFINVNFRRGREQGQPVLDAFVNLTPSMPQSYAIEVQGTNTAGNLGVSGSLVYRNKNLFRGAEMLQFRLTGGLEYQVVASNIQNQNFNNVLPFNTIEVNPELSLTIPKFLIPFKLNRIARYGNPKTIASIGFNFQQRPDYTRTIFNAKFGYTWAQNQDIQHFLNPVEVNFVNITNEAQAFLDRLENLQDRLLINTFSPHLTTTTNYTFVYSDQQVNKRENFSYLRVRLESSGNILRGIYSLTNAPRDTNNSYRMFNIPFSQYLKYEIDFRRYWQVSDYSQLVFRINQGIGFPLANLGALPFESSFFGGGANGIRAWSARSLGPGELPDSLNLNDQFGDVKLELNLEYRFDIYRWFKGAVFVDAGNIWLVNDDADRPGGVFEFNDFYKELAVGAGLGLRLDFSFFVIRFDAATPIRAPGRPETDRWAVQYFQWKDVNFNLGIGYPF